MEKSTLVIVGAILLSGMLISTSVLISRGNLEARIAAEVRRQLGGEEPELVEAGDLVVELASDDPYQGDKDTAEIAIIEFSDFECPFCARFNSDGRAGIKDNYVDSGSAILVWKDLPLPFYEPSNINQAQAAHCVWEQKQNQGFFDFKSGLFAKKEAGDAIELSQINEIASTIEGLNQKAFQECLENEDKLTKVRDNQEDAGILGVNGTPGVIIGRLEGDRVIDAIRVAGALPYSTFEQIIEDYLK
jgi:protein-disulfide isomerase